MVPELWWPDSGRIEPVAVYEVSDGCTRMPLHLSPEGSVFVVFRRGAAPADRIVSVQRDGETILDARIVPTRDVESTPGGVSTAQNNFTLAVWAKPTADTTLLPEANAGASGLSVPRNDVLFPPHGNTFGTANHAGSGLAVGRNGVCVFEHGAAYFAPVLVHALPLADWTHIAVVYRDAQPSLYVNGKLVHEGLKSMYTVHPGTAAGGGGRPFVGEMGAVETIPRAVQAEEIPALMQSMVRPGIRPAGAAVELARDSAGRVTLHAWQPGEYTLGCADGTQRTDPHRCHARTAEHCRPLGRAFRSALGRTGTDCLRRTLRLDAACGRRHPLLLRHGDLS